VRLDKSKKVTLHFRNRLDSDGANQIFSRIREDAIVSRKIQDTLSRTSTIGSVAIHVNLENQQILDSLTIKNNLVEHGFYLVSSGESSLVAELLERLTYQEKQDPKIILLRSLTNFVRGNVFEALSILMPLQAKREELAQTDLEYLDFLQDTCDLRIGRVSLEEYGRKENQFAGPNKSGFALSRQINYLKYALLNEGKNYNRIKLLNELRFCVKEISERFPADSALVLQARIALLHSEGGQATYEWADKVAIAQSAIMRSTKLTALEAASKIINNWLISAIKIVDDAYKSKHPQLIADAIVARSVVVFTHFSYRFLLFPGSLDITAKPITVRWTPETGQLGMLY
jgi:hypothetical protein